MKRLRKAIKKDHPRELSKGVVIFQEHAISHSALVTRGHKRQMSKREASEHPMYSADVGSCDLDTFCLTKEPLGKLGFVNDS